MYSILKKTGPYESIIKHGAARETIQVTPNNAYLYSAWILNGVARLHGYTEDGQFNGSLNPRVCFKNVF